MAYTETSDRGYLFQSYIGLQLLYRCQSWLAYDGFESDKAY